MLTKHAEGATEEERIEFEEWLGIKEIRRRTRSQERGARNESQRHIVSVTLFWKHVNGGDPELPVPTREYLIGARRLGLVKRFSPWECYIEPLFLHSAKIMERHPEVEFRLYLASDLEFLVPELTALGWDIHLMKSSSIRYCPGGFWRFLALEEEEALVTVLDSDRIAGVSEEIARTELMDRLGLGLWRVPGYYNADISKEIRYRPILGGHFGARGGQMPVRKLIEAFIWHWRHGSLTAQVALRFIPAGENRLQGGGILLCRGLPRLPALDKTFRKAG